MRSTKRRVGVVGVIVTLALSAAAFSPLAPSASAVPVLPSTCKATLAKVTIAGQTVLDPLVQENPPGGNCTTAGKTLVGPIDVLGLVQIEVGFVKTSVHGMTSPPERPFHFPKAHARASNINVSLTGLLIPLNVAVDVIEAKSKSRCVNGSPETATVGKIAGLSINGAPPLNVITDPFSLDLLGLVSLKLNQTVSSATNTQRTAFELSVPLLNTRVVIAQTATALTGADPCAAVAA